MNETFDVEAVLRDVLDVLRKHNIPIETAALNVSLLDAAFDEHIPQLATYKAGVFHRPIEIDNTPLLFRAERRYPFHEIVDVLERDVRPSVEAFSQSLQQQHPDLTIRFISNTSTPSEKHAYFLHVYQLGVECQFSDRIHDNYNQLNLSIFLQQREATEYPHLKSWVGWLVDEESGGDWGVEIVYQSSFGQLSYAPHHIDLLQRSLSGHFDTFRNQIARKRSGELDDLY